MHGSLFALSGHRLQIRVVVAQGGLKAAWRSVTPPVSQSRSTSSYYLLWTDTISIHMYNN